MIAPATPAALPILSGDGLRPVAQMPAPQQETSPARLLLWPLLLASVLLLLTLLATWYQYSRDAAAQEQLFQQAVAERMRAIDHQFAVYINSLVDLNGLIAASDEVRADEFQSFTKPQFQRHPDLQFIGWSLPAADGPLRVRYMVPESASLLYEQRLLTTLVPGLPRDLQPDVRTRQIRISSHADANNQVVLDLLQPVINTSLTAGGQRFLGYVHTRIRLASFLQRALQDMAPAGIDFYILRGGQNSADRELHYFHPSRLRDAQLPLRDPLQALASSTHVRRYEILIGGLDWQLALAAAPGRFDVHMAPQIGLLIAGLLLAAAAGGASFFALKTLHRQKLELEQQRKAWQILSERQQQTLEELDSFSYSVSHDLRAPLRHIRSYAQMLAEDLPANSDPATLDRVRRITESGAKMSRLMDDLLRLSRAGRTELRREMLNLSALVSSVYLEHREQYPKRDIHFRCQPELYANADAELLRLAIGNLLENALKYTLDRVLAEIQFGAELDSQGETVFYLRDNGCGFDMQFAERLFAPFNRLNAEDSFGGMGIGLAIVKRVITRHGGRIWARAAVNEGATFFFTLPVAQQNAGDAGGNG